jgi:hypothetical protein
MIDSQRRLTRDELVAALRSGWGDFLARLETWPEARAAAYARAQGFERVEDLLAHVYAWWGELLREIPAALRGELPARVEDVDAFNAAAVERARAWEPARVRREAAARYHAVVELIAGLCEDDLHNDQVYSWSMGESVTHWDMHRPQRREEAG